MESQDIDALWGRAEAYARAGDFEQIAQTLAVIAVFDRPMADRLAKRLFLFVVNLFPPFHREIDVSIKWVSQGQSWRRTFARAAFDGKKLRRVVEAALADFEAHMADRADRVSELVERVADVLDSVMVRAENASAASATLRQIRYKWNETDGSRPGVAILERALAAVSLSLGEPLDVEQGLQTITHLKAELRTLAARSRRRVPPPGDVSPSPL